MNRRISDLHIKIVSALDSQQAATKLVNSTRQFIFFTTKSEDDRNSKFPTAWKRLKSEHSKLVKPLNPTELQKSIIDLYETDETSAKQVWLNNFDVWKSRSDELSSEDIRNVTDLARLEEDDVRDK